MYPRQTGEKRNEILSSSSQKAPGQTDKFFESVSEELARFGRSVNKRPFYAASNTTNRKLGEEEEA